MDQVKDAFVSVFNDKTWHQIKDNMLAFSGVIFGIIVVIILITIGKSFCIPLSKIISSGQNRQKNNLKECDFVNSALRIQCHVSKLYTPTDCFLGDFAHWVYINLKW